MAQTLEAVFHRGDQDRTNYTPSGAVTVGKIVDLGARIGVCTSPEGIADAKLGSLATTGVFRVLKDDEGSVNFAKDAPVYFNTSTRLAVAAAGSNVIFIGVADAAAVNADDGVYVDINVSPVQTVDARIKALEDAQSVVARG